MTRASASRKIGAIRTALIGYGVLALALLQSRLGQADASAGVAAWSFLLWGVVIQLLLIAIGFSVRRIAPDEETRLRTMAMVELVGDGLTVLLFALGTFQAVLGPMAAL